MKLYEIGTGYTPIPATMGAATEIVVEELTKAFLKKGVPVEIVDIASENRAQTDLPIREVPVPKCFAGTDVKLGLMHKLKRVVYSVALAGQLQKILKTAEETVVLHFHNQYNLFFFLKLTPRKLRRKAILAYTNHSYVWHGEWSEIEDTVHRRYFQEIDCMKNADCVFVLNANTARNLTEHLGILPEKIVHIDNGVNTDIYAEQEALKKAEYRFRKNLTGKKVFVQVGSVCDRKNQLESLRLLLPLMREDPDIVFCYAGGVIDPEYKDAIEHLASENGVNDQVQYFGELQPGTQLNEFYNSAEMMVFPSKAEGFSLVIIEALSAGVPVMVNRNLQFALSENCLHYSDDEEFTDTARRLVADPDFRASIARVGREAVCHRFSWDKVASDYLSAFEQIQSTVLL